MCVNVGGRFVEGVTLGVVEGREVAKQLWLSLTGVSIYKIEISDGRCTSFRACM